MQNNINFLLKRSRCKKKLFTELTYCYIMLIEVKK
nr:MAG TPA: hypothetical protein [Caudoviricetes sp.]